MLIFVWFMNRKRQAKEKREGVCRWVNKVLNLTSDQTKTRDLRGAIYRPSFSSLMHDVSFIGGDFPRAEVFLFFVNSD